MGLTLDDVVYELREIKKVLREDRTWMWRLLLVTIGGAFGLIGLKLALP